MKDLCCVLWRVAPVLSIFVNYMIFGRWWWGLILKDCSISLKPNASNSVDEYDVLGNIINRRVFVEYCFNHVLSYLLKKFWGSFKFNHICLIFWQSLSAWQCVSGAVLHKG